LKGRGFGSRQERRKKILVQGQLSVLTLVSASVPPHVAAIEHKKDLGHSAKFAGELNIHIHFTYGASNSDTVS